MAAKRAKPSSKNAARGCKAGNVWLSSLHQREHSHNALEPAAATTPMAARDQSLPSLSSMAERQILLFKKQAGGKNKITHNDQRHVSIKVDRQKQTMSPNGKERQPSVHGGSIPSLPTTGSAALCTNVILISGLVGQSH